MVTYLKQAKEHVAALRNGGCAVSITNFGCTLNPLNTLKHVEVDMIKLDRSFTQDLNQEDNLDTTKKLSSEINALNKQLIVSYVENAARSLNFGQWVSVIYKAITYNLLRKTWFTKAPINQATSVFILTKRATNVSPFY